MRMVFDLSYFGALGLFICHLIGCNGVLAEGQSGSGTNKEKVEYGINYTYSDLKLSWEKANDTCSMHNASLLDFADEEDMLYLANFTGKLWIGLKKTASELIPANNTDEYLEREVWPWCYFGDHDAKGIRKRDNCDRFLPSICVKRKYEGKCDEGWEMNDEYCYLNVYSLMTWFAAFSHCLAKQSEMYVESVHGNSSGATMTKKQYWIGVAERRLPKPILGWQWANHEPLQWDKEKIVVLNYGCPGCGFVRNRTLHLNRCFNYLFICDGDSPSVYQDKQSKLSTSWEDSVLKCKAKYGNDSSLLPLSTLQFRETLDKLYDNGSIQFDKFYRIGLKKMNSSEKSCITTVISSETNMTEFRVRECSSFPCSALKISRIRHGDCDSRHHPVCVKDAKNESNDSQSCEPSWEVRITETGKKCVRVFTKVHMRWLTAYLFCQGQGGELLPPNMVDLFNNYSRTGLSVRCWVNDYKSFLPQDPLEGWKWPNGTLLNVSHNWGHTARLRDIKKEKRTGCAYVRSDRKDRVWEQSQCSAPLRFICKKKFAQHEESAREKILKILRSAIQSMSCQWESCTKEKKQSVEEFKISSTQRKIVEIVNSSIFNDSFTMVESNIKLTVFATEFIDLQYQTTNATSFPNKSIATMCQNRSSCIVKGVIMEISNIMISLSKSSNTSAARQADTMSVDYLVDGQLLNNLVKGEEVSLNFQVEEVVTESRVMCMFLDGLLWNTTGMKVNASKGNDVVKCVTSHFSSFAMVVLDSEPSKADKDALKFISYIGSGLSLVGLVLTCLIYIILYKDLQILTTSRHLVHLNLQIALGLTQIVFLAGGSATHDEIACKVVAILLHYVSLASFCWILLEAAMLYLKLISVYGGEFVRMRNFYAFGWGFPLIFVGLSSGSNINAYGSDNWCWLSYKEGFFWVFFAPVVIVTTVTLVVLIAVARVLFHAAKAQSSNMKYIVSAARSIIILFPTLGLSWAFSVIAVNHEAMIWKYLFVISTSTQGFLIFLIYGICNREIRSAIKRRIEVSPTTLTT